MSIVEVIDLLREQKIEAGRMRRGDTSIILTMSGNAAREFKLLIQRPGLDDVTKQLDEGELLDWWMHYE